MRPEQYGEDASCNRRGNERDAALEPKEIGTNTASVHDGARVCLELDALTGECREFVECTDGSRSTLSEGQHYYDLAVSDPQRRRLSKVLARVILQRALEQLALKGELGKDARQEAMRLVENDGRVELGALGFFRRLE